MTYGRWLTILCIFLLVTLAVLAAGMVLAVRIVRQPDYAAQTFDSSIIAQETAFIAHNRRCDILIDGDSTASIDIDPRVITSETGLSACNISSTRPVVDALGTLPLDTFLAHNPAPRVLVLQFGPEIFYRTTDWDHISAYAPYVLLLRQGTGSVALRTILLHPSASLQFLEVVLKLKFLPPSSEEQERLRGVFARTIATYNESGGRLNLELPVLSACQKQPTELNGPLDPQWIRQLREKYEARGIVTLVNSSPIPDCDLQLAKFQQELGPYLDANTKPMPIGLFVGGDRHMTADGAHVETAILADQIKAALANHQATSN